MQSFLVKLWKRRPSFFTGVLVVVALIGRDQWPDFALLFGVLMGGLGLLLLGCRAGLLVALCIGISFANLHVREAHAQQDEAKLAALEVRDIEARLLEDARGADGNWVAAARVSSPSLPGAKVLWAGGGAMPVAGTELRATGVFQPLEVARNPGSPDRGAWLRSQGIVGHFKASEMRTERWVGPFSRAAFRVRNAFYEAITKGLEPDTEAFHVIRAVVLGERSDDVIDLTRKFRESGTLHVFTVSGMHVVMVGGIAWVVLSLLRVDRRFAIPIIIAFMFGYSWLTGNGPAAVRAAWMGTVFLSAFLVRRRPDLLNAMGAVLLFNLLWDPRIIRMPGVQLSYGVVAAIGILSRYMRGLFDWIATKNLLLPISEYGGWRYRWLQFRQKLADALSVSTAASLGSVPLTLFYFGLVTPISIFATVALVPQVYLLLSTAIVSAVVSPFSSPLNIAINTVNARVATLCAITAGGFAKVPGAWVAPGVRRKESLLIYDLAFGNAAAAFVSGEGNAVLIDTGGNFALNFEVIPSLQRLGIHPDAAIFTHEDSGHVVSPNLMQSIYHIEQVAIPHPQTSSSSLSDWQEAVGVSSKFLEKGNKLALGSGSYAEILYAPAMHSVEGKADDRCVVMRILWNGACILWLSDAGEPTEQLLLRSDIDLRADILVTGSYEGGSSLSSEFISAISPSIVVVPRSPIGGVSASQAEQRKTWARSGIKVIDQRRSGGVTITTRGQGNLLIEGYLDKSKTTINAGAAGK